MAINHAQGTFEPQIPFNLFTKNDLDLLKALSVSMDNYGDDGLAYLYNEDYCTTGYIDIDGVQKEVTEDNLYKMLQEVIKRSNGDLKYITHEQAYTCDSMRRGEFGGSAVIITSDDIQYDGTSSWLERRITEVETGDFGPDTDDMPSAPPATQEEVNEALRDLITASNLVIQRWESGNLAEAVNNLMFAAGMAETTLESMKILEPKPINLAVVLDGGIVQSIVTDVPEAFKNVSAVVVDYDVDCPDPDDCLLGIVLDQDSELAAAHMQNIIIEPAAIDLGQVADFVSGKAYGHKQQSIAVCGGYPCTDCMDLLLDEESSCANEDKCLAWLKYQDDTKSACVNDAGPNCCSPEYKSTWDHDQHGEHINFPQEDWIFAVDHKKTTLTYQEWVTRNIESQLHETNLDGVDAIEIAGCTENDGIVEVIDEKDATFFSAYTHRPNEGVECTGDFNTKAQAVQFAKALAARTGIPVYGNLCSIEEA